VTLGAFRAHNDAEFNRWVGWATVVAVPFAALGILLVLLDKLTKPEPTAEARMGQIEEELAAVVLAQAQVERSRLIGASEPTDTAANVRFVRGTGRFREVGGASGGDLASVLEYYQSLSPRRLVVLGDPGAGKTVLALELLIRLLEERRQDSRLPVPLLISAAAYGTGQAWQDWLTDQLRLRFNMGKGAAARLVRDGRILPVVDGLDEMDPAGEPVRARALVAALNESMRGLERAPVVVTCRQTGYRVLIREVDRATHIEMVPLTGQEAAGYLRDQFLSADERQRWEPVLASLDASPDGLLAAQLATPWRLTLALAAFRDGGDPAALLPAAPALPGLARRYAEDVGGLLLRSYVPAAVRLHESAGRYTVPQVQRWLTALADGLALQARNGGSATDVRLDQWWLPTGGQRAIRLAHAALVGAVVLSLIFGMFGNLNLLTYGVAVLVVTWGAGGSPSPKRLRVRAITTRRGFRRLAVWLAVGVGAALEAGATFGVGLAAGLEVGGMLGVALGAGLALGVGDSSSQSVGPRDVIRADGRYGLAVGLILALGLGLASALTFGAGFEFTPGYTAGGLLFGFPVGFVLGARVWTRYHVTVVILAVGLQGPLRFGAFLDWAHQAGLLRVSGIAYQFRHRQLQDWLTSGRGAATSKPAP
jgi:hypothetical protein